MTCYINHASAICSLGDTLEGIAQTLFSSEDSLVSPLKITDQFTPGRALPLGVIESQLPTIDEPLYNTRNNRLLLHTLKQLEQPIEQLKQRYPSHRIGIVIGSSTSGILEGEQAVLHEHKHNSLPESFDYQQQEIGAPSEFVKHYLDNTGPVWTISTACTSGAKALASAARLLEMGVCDAVIAGGADSLCQLTVEGFSALSAVSSEVCNPFSQNRKGINIGEAAALFVLTQEQGPVKLTGIGETSDAHHISAPDPEAKGAIKAITDALNMANLMPSDIDYINLHGTATAHNDAMESLAVNQVFSCDTPCSSTKPLTGHTLGAAGALEAAFCWLTLQEENHRLPRQIWDQKYDSELAELKSFAVESSPNAVTKVMSNSFAFGGNNISLILETA